MSSQKQLSCHTNLSHEARLELTKKILKNMPPVRVPPKDFDITKASNKELVEVGLPARPDREKNPELRKMWENTMATRKFTFVKPEFRIIDNIERRPIDKDHFPEKVLPTSQGVSANSTSNIWSGAVLPFPPSGEKFNIISGSWIVPNAYPPPSAKRPDGTWNDGTWVCCTWIGIDGYGTDGVLQAGTVSQCTVTGGVLSQSAWAWYEWFPAAMIGINLSIKPGDLVHCIVCGAPGDGPGHVGLTNLSTNTVFPLTNVYEPTNPNNNNALVPIQGDTAEWITEDFETITGSNPVQYIPKPFANYGAMFMYNCWANSVGAGSHNTESNLTNALMLNIVQSGATLSTSFKETASVFQTTAYNEPNSNNPQD